jgi:hypothetical protein
MLTMRNLYNLMGCRLVLIALLFAFSISSNAAIYYISNTGNDTYTGTSESQAWKTLEKINATTFKAGDQILFKRGEVFNGTFTIKQSGTSGSPIVFGAYGTGDAPVISGFNNVTEWTNKGNNIWESTNTVSSLTNCNMVTINGVNTAMGRYPKLSAAKSGFLTFQSHTLYTSITSSQLPASPNWTGAEVVIRSNAYKYDRSTITSHSGGTLKYPSILNNPEDGAGFFIQNDIRCCTEQNEWYYSSSTKKISVYSSTQPTNVNVAAIERLVNLQANYITFRDLSFVGANGVAIYAGSSCSNIVVNNCSFKHLGVSGIYNRIHYLTVENSSFTDINNNSISADYGYNNIVVKNNTFENIGVLAGMKDLRTYPLANSNVEACEINNFTFEYNTVKNVGYVGVWFYGKNILVKNNFFERFCAILNDGGAIYTYTGGRTPMSNAVITGNICINSPNTGDGCSYPLTSPGIYLDYASANVEISYNSVANTYKNGIYISSGGNVNIHHNTVFNASEYQLFYMIDNDETLSTTDQVKYNTLVSKIKNPENEEGNYWGYQKCLVYVAYTPDPTGDIRKASNNLDFNCYARPVADDKVIFIDIAGEWNGKFRTLSEWQSYSGQDKNSYKSPQAITNVNDLRFEYNATLTAKTIALSQPMIDMKGNRYNESITLEPYSSIVLMTVNGTTPTPSSETNITAFSIPGQTGNSVINTTNRTIAVTMPYGTAVTSLKANFTLSNGATAKVGSISQMSGTTANNFTNPVVYTVTAQNGTTTANWTVTVTVAPNTATAITSFTLPGQTGNSVINATNRTIAITMPYGTAVTNLKATFALSAGATAKVGSTTQVSGTTANNFTNPVVYTITAQNGTTSASWTVTVTVATNTGTAITSFTLPGQSGNSVINATNRTIAITMPYGTAVTNLKATFALSAGATAKVGSTTQVSGTTANNFTNPVVYTITAQNGTTSANWTVTVTVASNTGTDINSFSFPAQTSMTIINSTARTVNITMPYGTSLSGLVATFNLSAGATAKVGSINQVSGTTANNFTNPVIYTITAQNGTTSANWTVTVTSAPNNKAEFTSFSLPGQTGNSVINTSSRTINVTMPNGTSVTSLKATFGLSSGATAKIGSTTQTSGVTANNFTNPLVYTVTAQDKTTSVNWTVVVTISGSSTNERTQVIDLKTGWNCISFNVLPSNTDFTSIFQSLIQSGVLIKIQDEKGNFMVNTDYGWYNNLGPVDVKEGYNVKVTSDVKLIITGEPVSTNFDIPLTAGYNIMSYPATTSSHALTMFQGLINEGSLVKVQDEAGKFIIKNGSSWYSNLDSLRPGKGYYVTVINNTSINFGQLKSGRITKAYVNTTSTSDNSTFFQKSYLGNPYFSMNFVLLNLPASDLKLADGDEIGIFDGNSCVGKIIYNSSNMVGVSAGMADIKTAINGFNPGDSITFQIWKASEKVLIKDISVKFLANSSNLFTPQGTAIVELKKNSTEQKPGKTNDALIRNYPNPFKDYTTFEFKLTEGQNVTLEIYNLKGKLVNVITNQYYAPGFYTLTWDGSSQDGKKIPGIYLYNFVVQFGYIKTGKIIFRR